MSVFIRLVACACLFIVVGCGTPGHLARVDGRIDSVKGKAGDESRSPQRQLSVLEEEAGSWIARASAPLEVSALPAKFSQNARMVSAEPVPIRDLLDTIAHLHGISIRLSRDALGATASGKDRGNTESDARQNAQSAQSGGTRATDAVTLNYTGTLAGLLDTIADRTGLHWQYKDGVVVYARLMTKTFQIKTMPGTSSYAATVGKSATGASASEGGAQMSFGANSSISMSSTMDYWQELLTTVRSMLSADGFAAPSSMTNSITVTDLPSVVERVSQLIDSENAVLGRQVGLRVQVFAVNTDDRSSSGVSWNLMFERAGIKLGLRGPGGDMSTSQGNSGSMSMSLLSGRMKGSQLVVEALSQLEKSAVVIDTTVVTLNNQPAPIAVTENQGYIARTSIAGGGLGGLAVATMEQQMITTGFILNLLPTILDNRSIMLQVQVDLSDLKKLETFRSDGSEVTAADRDDDNDKGGVAVTSLQTPHTSSIQTMQRASMKSGDMLVLAGFKRNRDVTNRSGVTSYRGGTEKATLIEEEILILITPELVRGV